MKFTYSKHGVIFLLILLNFYSCIPFEAPRSTRVNDIVTKMTIEEKIDFIGGYNNFYIRGYKHLGIPEIRLADGPVGVRNYGKSTSYPASICLAASFDKKTSYNVGKAIALEAREKNAHMMLGPGMNIYRMPLCGRNFEYLGEDPYLVAQLGKEYIIGMQQQGIIANAKHYVANNQEFDRHHTSSELDERTLHEIYLPAFKTAVEDANVATVMTSYNPINGIHASEHNYLINELLKGKWNFNGFVVSDWVSTYNGVAAANAGLDLEMPSGNKMNKNVLLSAIESNTVKVETIDDKIKRILSVYERFGLLDNANLTSDSTPNPEYFQEVALNAARGGMVLLENKNSILPFKNDIKNIAIIGPNRNGVTGGGGSSYVEPLRKVTLGQALNKEMPHTKIIESDGIFTGLPFPKDMFDNGNTYYYDERGLKRKGVKANYYLGKNLGSNKILTKYFDNFMLRNEILWNDDLIPETNFSIRFETFFTPESSGYYILGAIGDDGYKVFLDDVEVINLWKDQGDTKGKYEGFLNGGQEYKIKVEYYQAGGGALIGFNTKKGHLKTHPKKYNSKAVSIAKQVDAVILTVGFDEKTEGESFDRTFEMPYDQSKLINDIAKVNDNCIVVINAGGNVEMSSWIDNVKGVIMAWYPGQEGNQALAEIISGNLSPSGKLPVSFEFELEDNPCYTSYFDDNKDKKVNYSEGIFLGYRHWDRNLTNPRYPFGYGLSYSKFSLQNIKTDKEVYNKNETIQVYVTLQNIGDYDASEAVQLYISDKNSSVERPIKELKEFEKVFLKRGDQKLLSFNLKKEAFSFYDVKTHEWHLEEGEFEILLGHSSDNITQRTSIWIGNQEI